MTVALLLLLVVLGGGWLWTPDKDRTELEARYAGVGSEFAVIDGLRLHLRDSAPTAPAGQPTLILLHGFGASLHTWEPWAQALAPGWRVISLDLPGAGLTGADPGHNYTDARTLRLLLALMNERGVARASFVGHSMGGRLAWRMAAEHPERVHKLVLLAPDGFASPGFEYGKPPDVGLSVRAMRWVLPRRVLRMGLEPSYADPKKLDEATVDRYHDMLLAPGVRGALIARMEQLVLQDPVPLLQRIQAPTLLLWGAADAMIPPTHAQDYLRVMPSARLVLLPGLGHVPHEEAPEAALAPVLRFLAD